MARQRPLPEQLMLEGARSAPGAEAEPIVETQKMTALKREHPPAILDALRLQ